MKEADQKGGVKKYGGHKRMTLSPDCGPEGTALCVCQKL